MRRTLSQAKQIAGAVQNLMHRAPESFEKAVNRILAGDANFTGVK